MVLCGIIQANQQQGTVGAAADHAQAASILREYTRRRGRAFAEWFSIDPPFPAGVFGDPRLVPGAYCNGGIMPLVGGELARAAAVVAQAAANIEEVEHQRAFTTLPAQNAQLEMVIQTRGPEHIEQVLARLREAGMPADLDPY